MAQKRPTPAALGLHVPAYTLTCVACNYTAQSYNEYIGHLISCPDLPQVRCSHCSTTFTNTEELALHLGEPPLLSFLFDPPTTIVYHCGYNNRSYGVYYHVVPPSTFSLADIFSAYPNPSCYNIAGHHRSTTCISHPYSPLLGSLPCSPTHAQYGIPPTISVFLRKGQRSRRL